jgi:hypothetical protein
MSSLQEGHPPTPFQGAGRGDRNAKETAADLRYSLWPTAAVVDFHQADASAAVQSREQSSEQLFFHLRVAGHGQKGRQPPVFAVLSDEAIR